MFLPEAILYPALNLQNLILSTPNPTLKLLRKELQNNGVFCSVLGCSNGGMIILKPGTEHSVIFCFFPLKFRFRVRHTQIKVFRVLDKQDTAWLKGEKLENNRNECSVLFQVLGMQQMVARVLVAR